MVSQKLLKILLIVIPFIMAFQYVLDRKTYEDRLKLNEICESGSGFLLRNALLFVIGKVLGFTSHFSTRFGYEYTVVNFLSFHFKMVGTSLILSFLTETYCFHSFMAYSVMIMCLILEKKVGEAF